MLYAGIPPKGPVRRGGLDSEVCSFVVQMSAQLRTAEPLSLAPMRCASNPCRLATAHF